MKEAIIFTILGTLILWGGITYAPKLEQLLKNQATTPQTAQAPEQLIKEDLVLGTGREAKPDDRVSVHYVGTLVNGEKFDSSRDSGQPFEFILGRGQVIKGWDEGVVGMKVGGKRRLTIPPSLGYGSSTMGLIPSNSTLIFEIELLAIKVN